MKDNDEIKNLVKEEESSLTQILDFGNKFFFIIKRYFILLCIPLFLAVLYSYKKSQQLSTEYSATISFSLSEDRPQISYGSATITQQGFSFSSPNKLREYSFTERVGSKLLFKEYYYNGQEDYLINHYLKTFVGYKESYFKSFTDVASLNTQEYSVFKRVIAAIKESVSIENNINAEIYYITVKTIDENFTLLLCEAFYENLIDYYIERSTKKESSAVQFLQKRVDQLRVDLAKSEFNLAEYKDRANNLVTYKAELEEIKYNRSKLLLENDFMESSVKLEMAKTNLTAITPLFQVIDAPHLPLKSTPKSTLSIYALYIAIAIVANILAIAFLFFKYYYWQDLKLKIIKARNKNESISN